MCARGGGSPVARFVSSVGAAPTTDITCDVLFDGHELLRDVRVRVEGERVKEVAAAPGASDRAESQGGQTVHARFVMPGLIDSHVHIVGYVEGLPSGAPFEPMKQFVRLCSYNGVTSLRDTGNTLETLAYLREWCAKYVGPRVFGAGPLLDIPPLIWAQSRIVRDAEAARREVTRLKDHGVDLIKAYRNITPDILEAIVAAASSYDLPVAIDCSATSPMTAIAAGVRSFEHLTNLLGDELLPPSVKQLEGSAGRARMWAEADLSSGAPEALCELMLDKGTYLVPTILVSRRWSFFDEMVNDEHLDHTALVMPYHRYLKNLRNPIGGLIGKRYMNRYMPVAQLSRSERAEAQRGFEKMSELLRILHDAGVNIAAGTDSANPSLAPGFSLHQELREMVRCGMPARAVLRAATSSAAALIGSDELGVVRSGALADLLLIDGNPIERIEDLDRLQTVMIGGQWVDRPRLAERFRTDIAEANR